jgi:uncharacterized membrane protein YdjX (TVP38/TMEM64 family)
MTNGVPSPSRPAWPRWLLAGGVVVVIVAFYALGLNQYFSWDVLQANRDNWRNLVDQHLVLALLVFFAVYVSMAALSLPAAAILTTLAGALFDFWLGTVVASLASTTGATLAFLGSRYLFRDLVRQRLGNRLAPLERGLEQDGLFYLFTLRVVLLFPFFLVNLGMGLTPIRVLPYVLVSWVGMLPGCCLYVLVGASLKTIDSPRDLVSFPVLGSLALLGVAPLLLRKILQWLKK